MKNDELLEAIADKLESLRHVLLNRPVEVRHVHEAPPKPHSVTISIVSPEGYSETRTYGVGHTWELSPHLIAGGFLTPRKSRWSRSANKPEPNVHFPVRIQIQEIK